MWTLMLAGWMVSAQPIAAHHDGALDGDDVVWRSEIDVVGEGVVPLRRPLPAEVKVELQGAAPVRDAQGRLTGLRVASEGEVRVVVAVRHRRGRALLPPLVPAPERVAFTDGHTLAGMEASGVLRRIGSSSTEDVGDAHRDDLSHRFGRLGPAAMPLYLGPTTPAGLLADGLVADIQDAQHGRVSAALFVLGLAGLCVAALLVVVRALAKRAALERAERILEEEWRAFDRVHGA